MTLPRLSFGGSNRVAVGVYHDGAAVHAVRAAAGRDGWRFEATEAEGAVKAKAATGLAVDLPYGMVRRMEMPGADRATTGRAVRMQVETLLPGQEGRLRWGWQRTGGGEGAARVRRVLVFAVTG